MSVFALRGSSTSKLVSFVFVHFAWRTSRFDFAGCHWIKMMFRHEVVGEAAGENVVLLSLRFHRRIAGGVKVAVWEQASAKVNDTAQRAATQVIAPHSNTPT